MPTFQQSVTAGIFEIRGNVCYLSVKDYETERYVYVISERIMSSAGNR
jgi:hypothetical protein